jgi:hypothetical protein
MVLRFSLKWETRKKKLIAARTTEFITTVDSPYQFGKFGSCVGGIIRTQQNKLFTSVGLLINESDFPAMGRDLAPII